MNYNEIIKENATKYLKLFNIVSKNNDEAIDLLIEYFKAFMNSGETSLQNDESIVLLLNVVYESKLAIKENLLIALNLILDIDDTKFLELMGTSNSKDSEVAFKNIEDISKDEILNSIENVKAKDTLSDVIIKRQKPKRQIRPTIILLILVVAVLLVVPNLTTWIKNSRHDDTPTTTMEVPSSDTADRYVDDTALTN